MMTQFTTPVGPFLTWILATALSVPGLSAGDDPGADVLFGEAEELARSNQYPAAMEKVEAAVTQLERLYAADQPISWQGMNGLRFAARLARDEFLDHQKALLFCDKLAQFADSDYWRVPAHLERALTYRAMGKFTDAQREYDRIAEADQRQRSSAIIPHAEMVYFEIGDQLRGEPLIISALGSQEVHVRERFNLLARCARAAMSSGQREKALQWYSRAETLPVSKAAERARFLSQAWLEMGRIEESRGRLEVAKQFYFQAMQLPDGEMRFRVRARDAWESIDYFE